MPDFFIVGHAKCGTSALYEALRLHPEVFMPTNKEPWFFARNNPHPDPPRAGSLAVTYTGTRSESLDEYLALFKDAQPGQKLGEGSTSYIWSEAAPTAIARARPDARIIAILREPASFLCSLHLQLLANHTEEETDFRRALALDEERRAGRAIPKWAFWPQALIYSDRVRYVEQLRRYHAVFPPEQVLVIIYDDFRADNAAVLRRVLRFLDVDEDAPVEVPESNRTSRRVRYARVNDAARLLSMGRGRVFGSVNKTIKTVTSKRVRKAVLRPVYKRVVYGKPRPPDEQLMRELRERFKPEVVALSNYLDRDLVSLWGYDRL